MTTLSTSRSIALVGGIGYLIIFLSGIYANFFVLEPMWIQGDAGMTLDHIARNLPGFRTGILSFLVMVIFDLVLTWALYEIFRPVRESLARLAAWFRLVNVALFGEALARLVDVPSLVGQGESVAGEVLHSLEGFNSTWLTGLVFFGIHLLALGALVIRARGLPSWIGILLLIAGAGYLADSFAQFLYADYAKIRDLMSMVVILPGVVGELSLTIWLLVRGGRDRSAFAGAA